MTRDLGRRLRAASWIAWVTLAVQCDADDKARAARQGADAASEADVPDEPDAAVDPDSSTRTDATPPFEASTRTDAGDASEAGDGGADDDSTPCRDLATLAESVAFAPGAARLLATSSLGATVLSPLDWSVVRTYAGHRGRILGAAISADGTRGASVGDDGELRMWDASTGRTMVKQSLPDPLLVAFASSDSAVVVVDSTGVHAFPWGGSQRLWSSRSEAGVASPPMLATAPAGASVLVAAASGGLDLLQASDGTPIAHLEGDLGAFSPDGTRLATADGSTVRVVDVAQPSQAPVTLTSPVSVDAVGVGPSAEWVAVSGRAGLDNVTHVLRVPDGAILQTYRTSYGVGTLSPSPDGRLLAAAAGELYVFDVLAGGLAYSNQRRGFIWSQSFSTVDPLVAFARVGGDPEIWDLAAGRRLQVIPRRPSGNQGTLAFHPNGELLVNHDDTGTYWLPGGGAPGASFTYESGGRQPDDRGAVALSADGSTLAGPGAWDVPGNLRLWSATDGRLLRETPAHPDVIEALAWSPDGSLVATSGADDAAMDAGSDAGASRRAVKLWSSADGALVRKVTGHEDIVSSITFSPDGTLLASADRDGRVRLWSTADGALVHELSTPPTVTGLTVDSFNGSVAFSPDGRWLASRAVHWIPTGHSVYIAVYRVADGTLARELRGYGDGNLGALGWSPDGRFLVGGAGPELRVWCMTPDAGGPTDAAAD